MLRDLIQETTNAPGTAATVNLAGPPTGLRAWGSGFASGAAAYYGMHDGVSFEWGYGTYNAGSPNTFTRGTVLGNSLGTTARINFTGATQVYNEVPGLRAVYQDAASVVNIVGPAGSTMLTLGSATTTAAGAQVQYFGTNSSFYTRVNQTNGQFEFVNGAYTAAVATISQAGVLAAQSLQMLGTGGSQINYTNSNGLSVQQTSVVTGVSAVVCQVVHVSNPLLYMQYFATNVGSITTNGSSVAYNTTSDHRLKVIFGAANEPDLEGADSGAILDAIPIYLAEMKFGERRLMAIAHEIQAVCPDLVTGERDALRWRMPGQVDGMLTAPMGAQPEGAEPMMDGATQAIAPQMVDYTGLIPTLVAEIQSLRRRLAVLEAP